MQGVVIHAPKDLRIGTLAVPALQRNQVRVEVKVGGICGSDLHYFHNGGFGTVRLREPMVLGHEFAGTIIELGEDVRHVAIGSRVAVNPSLPCGECHFCRQGMRNHCVDMRFMGSAMRFPHAQGGFSQSVVVDASQAIPIPASLTMAEAAMAEPLAVCLHAAHQAGSMLGRRVLITGSGPIGALSILVARYAGASEIAVTDVQEFPLAMAVRAGADRVFDTRSDPMGLARYCKDNGPFDIVIEASGAEAALRNAIEAVRPGGTIVQLGLGGSPNVPVNLIVTRELRLLGTFRFDREFLLAVELMSAGRIDVKPLITSTLPFAKAVEAFELASDRSRSMKVQLDFQER